MKAAVNTRYGSPDVIEVREVPTPKPAKNELLVRVLASTVTRTDCGMLRAHPFFARFFTGLLRPKRTILGMDFAGEVEAVGETVTRFAPGDRVFGMTPDDFGAHAEFVSVAEDGPVAAAPATLQPREMVVCEGAWYADCSLRALGLKSGETILIYGASGAIGVAAVQLARARGARVTAVVGTDHVALARSLGANQVIDYQSEDYTRIGERFDYVFDAVGKTSFFRCRQLLKPHGTYAATDLGPWGQNIWLSLWSALARNRRVIFALPKVRRDFIGRLGSLLERGEFRAVIDREYPLAAIADAYRYVETGRKTGIVTVIVGDGAGRGGVSRPA